MSIDPLQNPYAPPATPAAAPAGAQARGATRSYRDERRSVLLLFALTVITLGVYPSIWFFRRRHFLASLDSTRKLGPFAAAPLAATCISFTVGAASALVNVPPGFDRLVSVVGGIVTIVTAFRVATILRSDFARTGRFLHISGPGTFFFNAFYLQHKINQAAETPARGPQRDEG
jgi:hypothetical protein